MNRRYARKRTRNRNTHRNITIKNYLRPRIFKTGNRNGLTLKNRRVVQNGFWLTAKRLSRVTHVNSARRLNKRIITNTRGKARGLNNQIVMRNTKNIRLIGFTPKGSNSTIKRTRNLLLIINSRSNNSTTVTRSTTGLGLRVRTRTFV